MNYISELQDIRFLLELIEESVSCVTLLIFLLSLPLHFFEGLFVLIHLTIVDKVFIALKKVNTLCIIFS